MQPLPEILTRAVIPAGVRSVLDRLLAAGHEAWLVGGGVRDLLRGGHPKDWDVATEALPEQRGEAVTGASCRRESPMGR
jgi:poly(A) polymerase